MSKIRLKVKRNQSLVTRLMLRLEKGGRPVLFALLLLVVATFLSRELLPMLIKVKAISYQINSLQRRIPRNHSSLKAREALLASNDNWRIVNRRHKEFCVSPMIAEKRLERLLADLGLTNMQMLLSDSEEYSFGHDFKFQSQSSYNHLLELVAALEDEFVQLKIKNVHMQPEIAENKYDGSIRLSVEGWMW